MRKILLALALLLSFTYADSQNLLDYAGLSSRVSDIAYTKAKLSSDYRLKTLAGAEKSGPGDKEHAYKTNAARFTTAGPANISNGILMWLDASDVDADNNPANDPVNNQSLNRWKDKSGLAHDATTLAGQNNVVFNTNQINGKAVVHFTRVDDSHGSVLEAAGVDIRAGANSKITMFTVYKPATHDGSGQGQALWGNDNGAWDRFYYDSWAGTDDGIVSLGPVNPTFTNVTGAGAPGSLHLLTAVYDNITPNGSAIYFNGAVVTIFTDHTDSSAAQHDLRIGFDGDNGNYNGDIAEMIVYNRVLTECEIQQVNQYLAAKYGVAFTSATITAGGPTSICAGNFVTLTASNGASFQWYKDGVIIPGATAQGYNASQTGSYTVTITSFNNCTASSGATTITVNPLPIVTASSNSPVQQGQSIFLNAVGALNYFWTGPNSFIANNQQNVSIPNAQTALAGTYTVKGQDANGCSATASVNIVVGPPAGALDFDGVNDYVRIANPYTSFDKELTVEWSVLIDPSSAVGSGISQSLENIEGANSLVWMMHFNGDPASPAIQFFVSDNGTWKNADAPVPAGWHRFVGTASASGIRIYMDGNLIATSPGIVNNILNVSNAVIHFGKDSRYPDRWMKGQMDEIRIWNRALCQSELQNSNSCEYQGPQNGLVEYYKFNQGVVGVNNAGITLLPDLSSNGRDGLLNNFTLNGAASNWVSGVISGVCSVYDPFNPPIYGGSVTFCMPGSLNMFTDPIAGATYQWFRNGNPIAGETQSSYFISQPSQSGVYKVQVTLADGCSGTSHTETVKVNPLPAVFDITGSGAYCANTPTGVAVGLSGSEVGVMYQLKSGVANIGGAVAGTGGPLSFGNQLMGSYSVTATGAGNCAQGMRGVANVTTNPPPPAFINNGPSGTQCQGGTVRLSAPTGPGGFLYNYAWSNNQNGQFIDVTTGGTYTVTVTDPNTGCSSTSAPFTVVFNPLPIVFNVTGGGGYCVNTSTGVAVGLSGSQVGVNYQLKSGPNNIGAFVAGTGNAISFGNKLIGNYSVVAINPVTNCSQNMNGNVNVNNFPLPPAFINSSPAQCQGGTVRLSAPTGPGGSLYNYLWSNNQNGQFIDVTTGGTYTVTVTDPNTTCSSTSAPLTVTFNPRPTVFNVTGGGGYCANTPTAVAVGLTGSEVGVNYQLMSGGNNIGPFVAGTGNAISFGNKLSGNYSVVATNPVTNCSQNMNGNANVNIFPTPPAFITNSSPVTQCQGATVTLSAPTGPGGFLYNYLWSNNQTGQSINVTTGGTYTVTVTDPGTSCSATSAPLTVTFSPLPTVSTSFINVTCVGANNGSITVTAQGAGPFTYSKDGGTTFQPSNTFTGLPPGNYNVVVKGVCTSSPQAVTITTVADVIPPTLTLNSVGGSLTSLSGLNTYPTNVSGGALRHGHGIAYDLQRNTVWVTDNELNNDVFEFAATQPAGTTLTPLTRFHAPVTTTIEGIAFDATDNTLWIVDFNGVILHIDRSNNTLSGGFNVSATIPSATFGATGLGIALQDNFIWIDNGVRAYKFNKSGGAYTGFSFATGQPGITYDPERHVLWSSGWYDGIYRAFDPATGNLVFTSGVISFPQGHDVSIGAGRIWIVSENDTNDKIYSIGINGGSIDQIVECHGVFNDPGYTASDNCGIPAVTLTGSVNTNVPGTYTLTYKATDNSNNITTVIRTVTVLDRTPPVPNLASLPPVTGQCSAVVTAPTATDACSSGTITATTPQTTFNSQGTFNVVWTYRDANGNIATQNQTVTVKDTQFPVLTGVPPDVTVECGFVPAPPIDVTATDNCSTSPVSFTETRINGRCSSSYTLKRSWTTTDIGGNKTVQSQFITVQDNTKPVLSAAPGNATVECNAVPAPAVLTASDNCDASPVVSYNEVRTNGESGNRYTLTRTWTATDACGNSSTKTQVITVQDTKAPVANVQTLPVITGECSATVTTVPTATDNCAGVVTGITTDPLSYNTQGTHVITWTYDDGHGNKTIQEQTVIVEDLTPPVVIVKNISRTITTETGPYTVSVADIDNNSYDNCGIIARILSGNTTFDCSTPSGDYIVTLTVTDAQGLTTSADATVTIVNACNRAPVAICTPAVVNAAPGSCSASVSAHDLGLRSTDPDGDLLTYSMSPEGPFTTGVHQVTIIVTDPGGLSSSCTTTITVVDKQAPVPNVASLATVTAECAASVSTPTATDNCSGTITGITTDATLFTHQGTYHIHWTYDDGNGNVSSQDQTVVIKDDVKPVIIAPASITTNNNPGKCSATVSLGKAGVEDNCDIVSVSNDAPAVFTVGTTTVTWTATDAGGNTASATQTVTVTDAEYPVALAQTVTVNLVNGTGTITAAMINNGSTDNCATDSMWLSKYSFNCSNIGSNAIVFSVRDVHGHISTANATVIVNGTTSMVSIVSVPTVNTYTGGNPLNLYLGYGAQSTVLSTTVTGTGNTYAWTGNGAAKLSSKTTANPVFTPDAAGVYDFTVTVTTASGCTSQGSISICVKDIRVPGAAGAGKVYVCHVPPGNPGNTHTISISTSAVPAHLQNHAGDKLGACDQVCGSVASVARDIVGVTAEPKATSPNTISPNTTTAIASTQSQQKTGGELKGGVPSMKISPVPNKGYFNVELLNYPAGKAEIRIADMSGKIIALKTVEVGKVNIFNFNLANKASGTYYVTVLGQKTVISGKVIIQR